MYDTYKIVVDLTIHHSSFKLPLHSFDFDRSFDLNKRHTGVVEIDGVQYRYCLNHANRHGSSVNIFADGDFTGK